MGTPRYLVWVNSKMFYPCDWLADALEQAEKTGGTIYEPLAMTTAEKVASEPNEEIDLDDDGPPDPRMIDTRKHCPLCSQKMDLMPVAGSVYAEQWECPGCNNKEEAPHPLRHL